MRIEKYVEFDLGIDGSMEEDHPGGTTRGAARNSWAGKARAGLTRTGGGGTSNRLGKRGRLRSTERYREV